MTLEAGTRLGRYEIKSLLGIGGMGEVYRAFDAELQRPVALKILPAEFALQANRMQRFIQEARAASALNHPNIITVYEIGRVTDDPNAAPYFAIELIEGVTLREYLSKSKLRLVDVLDLAGQIASALVAAHQAGIIHRDIKPENIMVRNDGYVKVLDFGLAKPTERNSSAINSEAETRALAHTDPGTIMGTVSYMSPEQAKGGDVDARTDIWSLGVVLYEMVTGALPFTGATPSHVIVSLLEKEPPPLAAHVADVPEALELIIDEALRKDREERTQTAKQLLASLRRLKQRIEAGAEYERSFAASFASDAGLSRFTDYRSGQSTGERLARSTVRSGELAQQTAQTSSAEYLVTQIKRHRAAVIVTLIAIAGVAVAAYSFIGTRKPSVPLAPMKITKLTNNGGSSGAVISPDGKYVAHVFTVGDKRSLLLRQTATSTSREIVPLTNAYLLGATFSHDGNFLYYVKGERGQIVRTLYQVSVLGGDPRQLVYDIDSSVTISPDGKKIAFIRGYLKELRKVLFIANADGSGEEAITSRRAPQFSSMDNPVWSPDGTSIAFISGGNDAQGYFVNIDEVRVADKSERKISADRWRSIVAIVWLSDNSGLLAVARDRAAVAGSPNQLWHVSNNDGSVRRVSNDLNYYVDISIAGDSQALAATVQNDVSTVWVGSAGDLSSIRQISTSALSGFDGVAWTPDGRVVYTSLERDNRDIWIMNSDGSNLKQLTFETSADLFPSVSPDGRYIVYVSNRGVGWGIWRMNVDGSNQIELVPNTEEENGLPQFTADSSSVIYLARKEGKTVLWRVPIDGGKPSQLTSKPMFGHVISPNGQEILYHYRSPELDSKLQVEVIPVQGGEVIRTFPNISDANLTRWSSDGKAIDYVETREGVGNLWRQPIDGGQPRRLSTWQQNLIFKFAWSGDGKQFVCARGARTNDVVLIENLHLNQ